LSAFPGRHIPARVKKHLQQKYGGRCAFPDCKNPAEINHHIKRFALEQSHDPDFIVPLCKNHERIAHHGLMENEEQMPENWKVRREADKNSLKFVVDRMVQRHRALQNESPNPKFTMV